MGTHQYVSLAQAQRRVEQSVATSCQIVQVAGAPRSGKSRLAFNLLVAPTAADLVRQGQAALVVSHRLKADSLNNQLIQTVGYSRRRRPVRTLTSLAFDVMQHYRQTAGLTPPKLLDGAEQGAVIRAVLNQHISHAKRGDDQSCPTCRLIKTYFALVPADEEGQPESGGSLGSGETTAQSFEARLSSAFADQLRDMFSRLSELHFGVDSTAELGRIEALANIPARQRVEWDLAFALRREYALLLERTFPDQYRLDSAYALVEAEGCVRQSLAARQIAPTGLEPDGQADVLELPRLVVVDDSQDLTLAGYSFLMALVDAGSKLVLIGSDDESVQGFRGAYPEVVSRLVGRDPAHRVESLELEPETVTEFAGQAGQSATETVSAPTYARTVAARVSQAIGSVFLSDIPVPDRPGKLPLPDSPAAILPADDSVQVNLFHTPAAELDHLVWQLRSLRLGLEQTGQSDSNPQGAQAGREAKAAQKARPAWSDMAVIAHDNATLRAVGQRLEQEGIPVAYSSVSKPLKEEPVIQGLLALLELVELVVAVRQGHQLPASELAALRSQVRQASLSPLFDRAGAGQATTLAAGSQSDQPPSQRAHRSTATGRLERPVRLERVQAAVESLRSLRGVVERPAAADAQIDSSATDTVQSLSAFYQLLDVAWRGSVTKEAESIGSLSLESVCVMELCAQPDVVATLESTLDSLLVRGRRSGRVLQTGAGAAPAQGADKAGRVLHSKDLRVLHALAAVVRSAADQATTSDSVEDRLWRVWAACGQAEAWQRESLTADYRGRLANARLDAVMRLFAHAQADTSLSQAAELEMMTQADQSVRGPEPGLVSQFVKRVQSLEIEADSLAKVAPKMDAVVLTTPAGAAGSSFDYVWLLDLQRGSWPNLTARNTLFGSELLASLVLSSRLGQSAAVPDAHSQRLTVLYSELKGFLVALTRAKVRTSLSAVTSEESVPSEFLVAFLHELVGPSQADLAAASDSWEAAQTRLTASVRGLVSLARGRLAQARLGRVDESVGQDAAQALAYLARAGVAEADPDSWMFAGAVGDAVETLAESAAVGESSQSAEPLAMSAQADRPIKLSPSSVDRIWACPLHWSLQNRFSGPQAGSQATGFGSLIHAVAEQASRQGWDQDSTMDVESVYASMWAYYQALQAEQPLSDNPVDRFAAPEMTERAQKAIANIAQYFVDSRAADYSSIGAKDKPTALDPAGALREVQVERSFSATFSLADIIALAEQTEDLSRIDKAELVAALAGLVDGFAEDFDPDRQPIYLHGRIDRLERRAAGGSAEGRADKLHVIDYKTGHSSHTAKEIFSDLQLVCYQLGLTFGQLDPLEDGEDGYGRQINSQSGHRSSDELNDLPIERSMLFDVEYQVSPAADRKKPEINYQPALVRSGAFNSTFAARSTTGKGKAKLSSLFDPPSALTTIAAALRPAEEGLANEPPALGYQFDPADPVQAALARLVEAAGADSQLVWCLTMLARVLYAASYSVADQVIAKRGGTCKYCDFKAVCPLWPGDSANLYDQAAGVLSQEALRD